MYFNEVIGHKGIIDQLHSSIENNKMSHAHLFVGEDGIGKSILANEAALMYIGGKHGRQYVDIQLYRLAENKLSIGIDEIQSIIKEINIKPFEMDKKVIIIYDADKMTEDAQNSFLKTIEEPPSNVCIMLLAQNSESIYDTIRSRCQIHKLTRLNNLEMREYLKKKYPKISEEDFKIALSFADGVPGRAEKFIEDEGFKSLRNEIIKLLMSIKSMNIDEILRYEELFIKFRYSYEDVFTCILSYIRDIIVYKEIGKDSMIINIDKIESITQLSSRFSFKQLKDIIEIVNSSRILISSNANYTLVYDSLIFKLQEV